MKPKPCACPAAGFCARHNRVKGPNAWKLCRTRADYRAMWDEQQLPPREPCALLGELLRMEGCRKCKGRVRIKVFACPIFGACSLAKELPGVACCVGCVEYRAK